MRSKLLLLALLFCGVSIYAQRTGSTAQGKEWSRTGALFGAKSFIFKNILGVSEQVKKFSLIPLYAATSDELTTVFYTSDEPKQKGLVLCFYGMFWNEAGIIYTGYSYKHLPQDKALSLLKKIESVIEDNEKFLKDEKNINNIFFEFEDLNILVYHESGIKMRVYWGDFDSTWEERAFTWTKTRFEREL